MISNKRGSALIIVYMVIAVLTILGTGIMSRELSEISNTRRYSDAVRAFWFAEAGIYKELYELNYPSTDVGWPGSGEVRDVAITNISSSTKMINVTGYFDNSSATISVLAAKSGSPFNFAAFGNTSLSISGQGNVSSYNSTSDPSGTVRLSNGDIGTNGDITMSGQAFVYGDAATGPDGEFEDEDNDYISGNVTQDSDVYLTAVTVPSELENVTLGNSVSASWSPAAGNYRIPSISLAGQNTVTLTGPTNLYLTSTGTALAVSGQAEIVISNSSTGPVTIYTPGDISLAGQGITNEAVTPSKLLIYGTSTDSQTFACAGQGDFYGAYYAPNGDIRLSGQGDLFGSFIGDTVAISGQGNIRYDESLKTLNTTLGTYSIIAWKDSRNF
ncbi:MAG TPA: hypothetical protein PLP56_06135 [Candidatus Omnitrophota bacterium]|mgnify:CR=1 FL=1|nr:hypothetical protein [Candidatus Omnitrophota bacterium]HQQ06538.1 hypothetical protein [Candidatus Omnitrophota bacterium]